RVTTAAVEIRDRLRTAAALPPLSEWLAAAPASAPDSWEDYESRRKLLADKNDADACVRLGVAALLALPAGPETIARLWPVANDADWQERRAGVAAANPALPVLLDLADLLPATHDTRLECRFLRGQYLTRRGDHAAVRALFESLFAEPGFPPLYHLTARVRLGEACEQLGDYPAALAATRALEGDLADSSRNTDRVLRAVFINLHLVRTDEAARLIALLETVPDKILLQTTHEYFIREFIELRRAGRAEAFWRESSTWWPEWEKFAASLRLPPAGLETTVPVIPELSVLGESLRQAERAKDNTAYWHGFRTLVSAARWLPSLAPEVSGVAAQAGRMAPGRNADFGRLILAQLRVPGFPEANVRLRGFHIAATYHDLGDHPAALAAVAAYRAAGHPLDDPLTRAVNRIWAMSARASARELAEASAALEHDLADATLATLRSLSVELLADLYRARHLDREEASLLERELANPHIVADTKARERLAERQVQLGGSVRLAEGVREWLRVNPLPWFDHAEPASLDDPRLRDLVAVLENPERQFSPGEIIKLRLLAAQNPGLGLARQSDALSRAVESLHETSPTHSEAARIADSFIDNPAFEESTRALFLWHLVIDAYNHGRHADFDRWQAHPLAARYNQLQKDFVAGLARSRALDTSDPAALAAFADTLVATELGELEVAQLQEIFAHYIRLDDLARAQALAASTPVWRFSSSYTGSRESNALRFTRTLSAAEAQAPV
ncbi:MAG: hypothetical protein H7067_08425, partial [Burkholderiales bacterium]|nr:hypothetical protein [Opitutaceae bacterium]